MNLLYLSASAVPSRMANSVHVMRMCEALAGGGTDVTLVTIDRPFREADAGDPFAFYGVEPRFHLHAVPWRFGRAGTFAAYALAAPRLARCARAEVVLGRFLPGCLTVARAGVPTWYEAHTPPPGRIGRALYARLVRARGYRGTIVINDALRAHYEALHAALGAEQVPVVVEPDAASDPGPPAPEPVGFRVGYVGHLYPGRGVESILELARRLPDVPFSLVGGTEADLAHWRSSPDLPPNATLHGFVPPADTEAHRSAASVLLAPYSTRVSGLTGTEDTTRWMSPLKVFEYMASNRAIIASDLPAIREVLTHDHDALLCPPDDPGMWHEALERLRDDAALRHRLAAAARAAFDARHSWSARAARLLGHFGAAAGDR